MLLIVWYSLLVSWSHAHKTEQIPGLKEDYKSLNLHINIAELVMEGSGMPGFRRRWQAERAILEGDESYEVRPCLLGPLSDRTLQITSESKTRASHVSDDPTNDKYRYCGHLSGSQRIVQARSVEHRVQTWSRHLSALLSAFATSDAIKRLREWRRSTCS